MHRDHKVSNPMSINQSINQSCLEIRMQDEFTLRRFIIVSLKCGRFQIFGKALRNQNSIQEETKSRWKSGNAYHHSVQNLLSSMLLSKNLKIRMYRIIILPVVLYGCETCSLTTREERRLRVSEKRVLKRIFGHRRDEVTGVWRKLQNEEINDLYSSPNIGRVIISRRMR